MQTIYTTSCRLGVRENIVDLNAYRRQLGLGVEEPEQSIEVEPLVWARAERTDREESRPRGVARRCAGVSAWLMDICASAGVLAMTLAFTMQIL